MSDTVTNGLHVLSIFTILWGRYRSTGSLQPINGLYFKDIFANELFQTWKMFSHRSNAVGTSLGWGGLLQPVRLIANTYKWVSLWEVHPESSLGCDELPSSSVLTFISGTWLYSHIFLMDRWTMGMKPPQVKSFGLAVEKLTCCNKRNPEIQWLKENNILLLC